MTTTRKAKGPKRIHSQHAPHRYWELWTWDTGERVIMLFERNERCEMVRREVAYLRTRKHRTENKPSSGWGCHTTVTWETYCYRWMDRIGGGYPSPEAAFRAFCSNL